MMKSLLLLVGLLLVTQTWAKPKNVDENELQAEEGYRQNDDPCHEHHCSLGKECDLNENDKPICVCARKCDEEDSDRVKVCSTTNATFSSECEMHRQKCLCHKNQEGCENREYKHAQLDYFGPCVEISECTEEQMEDFPLRMRNWLFLVMEELADRKELSKPAIKLAKKAEKQQKRWVLPVIWKFCDLDRTHDLFVDSHELVPISAPLKPMEHCTGPFLEKCDADEDGHIDLREWTTCLRLDDEDMKDDLEALCDQLQD